MDAPVWARRAPSALLRASIAPDVALHRLNQLVLGAAGQRPELDEVRVAGRGTPGAGRHRIDAELVLEQLLVEPADVRVVGHRGGRGQRPERLFARGLVLRLEPLEQRAEGLPVGVELGALTVELEESGLVRGELVTRAGKLLAAPEGAEPGLRQLQEAVVLGELLGQELTLPARPLAGPLDVQHLERLDGAVHHLLGGARILRHEGDVDHVGHLAAGDQQPDQEGVDGRFAGADPEGDRLGGRA